MRCPKCYSENPTDTQYCGKCGTKLPSAQPVRGTGPTDNGIAVSHTKTIQTSRKELGAASMIAGKYEIDEELGRGGMGVVHKAEDTKLKRTVALKFLPPELTRNLQARERFVQEARAASGLDHPNICTIYEIEETDDGRVFIAMAYYEGESLKDKIERGPLNPDEAVDISIQVARGLAKAHKKGIIHRDIKPANIMITNDGIVKIVDFGLAKLSGQVRLTQTGITLGTVAYMSPEQTLGEDVDQRTDIWALGAMLYEMVTGALPFRGANEQAMIYSILNKKPRLASELKKEVSSELEHVLKKTMAKDANKRYESADELLIDLENLRVGITVTSAAVSEEEKNSVAVINFVNITGDSEIDWLSEGIAETVTVDLKKISALSVVSREKVLKIMKPLAEQKITEQQIIDLGQNLRVRWIVWGGFQKYGNAIRITSHFTDVSTGNLVGSSKVDGSMNDIFKLQDKIITSLIDTFSLEVSDSELKKIETPETVEVQAYEYYAKGRQIFIQMGQESFDKAQNFLEKALEVDSEYALAYSGLGAIHTLRFIAQTNPEYLEIGISYLQKAAKLDPDLAEPYLWLTYSYTRKRLFEDAIRSGSRAVELEPDNPLAHYFLGVAYHVRAAMKYKTNRYIDAIRHYKKNVELQPSYQIAYMNMAWIYLLHGQYQEAKENLERAVAIEESGKAVLVKFVGALTLIGNVYFRQDQLDTALDWYRRSIAVLEKADHVYREPFIALTYCGMGDINFRRCHYGESIEHYKRACDLISQHPRSLGVGYFLLKARLGLARAFHLLGMNRESKQQFQEAFELFKNKEEYDFSWIWEGCDAQTYYDFASYFAVINHQKDAFKYLQKAIECGWRDLPFLQSDDLFSRFRNKTEFADLVQELKNRKPLP